jgi:C4-dicarboxylate-specific signal transduction histidine kinase
MTNRFTIADRLLMLRTIIGDEHMSEDARAYIDGILTDVVELEREALSLRDLAVATSKLAELGRAAAAQNHELRQPVQAIRAYAEFLLEDADKPDQVKSHAQQIREQSARMTKLLGTLRAITMVKGEDKDSSDAREVIRAVVGLVAYRIGRRVSLDLDLPEADFPLVQGAPDKLEQVFLNLVTNAIDAVEDKGTTGGVVVAVRRGEKPIFVDVFIGDDGAGVSPEARAKMFQGFFTTKGGGRGTGLGLLISRGLARAAGGTIELLSPQEASRFGPWPRELKTLFRVTLRVVV